MKADSLRREEDLLGAADVPSHALYGIHTVRAVDNFPLSGRRVHPALIHAFGAVKLAAAQTNRAVGAWKNDASKADAIEAACIEMMRGLLDEHIVVDALQGGAGTSTNMNVNEVLANRALQLCGDALGNYVRISPLDDLNLHQSTNDAYPTALKLAAIRRIRALEESLAALVESFQRKEQAFAHVSKIARTQMQEAIPTTLGREMAAYAAAFGRDRWRLSKCEERLRVLNLGGTAIGTGMTAPRAYIFRVVDILRDLTGIGFARAEDMVENTQNADVYAEVSGLLRTCATNFMKCASDLRFLSSGPNAGIGEIALPARQAGSSIIPGKVNPVIPEAVTQAAIAVYGYDVHIATAAGMGNLELNPFLPLIADSLLASIDLLAHAADMLREKCVDGISANEKRCNASLEGSTTLATALVERIGHEKSVHVAQRARTEGKSIREIVLEEKLMSEEDFEKQMKPESFLRLGTP